MSALLAFVLAQAAGGPAAPPAEQEIVVIAQRLKDWRGTGRIRKGKFACETIKSTGDLEIDAIGCTAMVSCMSPHLSEFEAIRKSKDDCATRAAKSDALIKSTIPCVFETRKQGIAELAQRRSAQ